MSDWKVSSGRIALFASSPAQPPSALQVYQSVWGTDPENFQKSPNAMMPAVAQGKRRGMAVACSVHPSRLDFHLSAASSMDVNAPLNSLPQIDNARNFRAALQEITQAVGRGINLGTVVRVGVYIQFQAEEPSIVDANKSLLAALPAKYKIGITDEEEVVFQVNVPYMSDKVRGVRMNCTTKWSVDQLQILKFQFPAGGSLANFDAKSLSGAPETQKFIASGVSLDVSSPNLITPPAALIAEADQSLLLDEALSVMDQKMRDIALNVRGFHYV